jgi:hypothetical protein
MADVTTVLVAKIATIRGSVNTDATTALSIQIPTYRATNAATAKDVNTALRDAP